MKRKHFLSLLICFILSVCLLASCSQAPSESMGTDKNYGGAGFTSEDGATMEDTEVTASSQKLIQNLYLTIEVKQVEDAYQTLLNKAISLGGYEFERNYSKSGDYQSLYAVVKVPADQLTVFSQDAEVVGNILNNELTTEDISESYYDVQTRLTTMEKTLEKYYGFLEQAKTLEEQLSITKQIDQLTYEIEALKGKIAKWDNQVEYATVTLRIYEYDDPSIKKKDIQWNSLSWDDMWYLIKSGFMGFTSFIVSALQWILVAVAASAVISIPLLILAIRWIVKKIKKKKELKRVQEQAAKQKTEDI